MDALILGLGWAACFLSGVATGVFIIPAVIDARRDRRAR